MNRKYFQKAAFALAGLSTLVTSVTPAFAGDDAEAAALVWNGHFTTNDKGWETNANAKIDKFAYVAKVANIANNGGTTYASASQCVDLSNKDDYRFAARMNLYSELERTGRVSVRLNLYKFAGCAGALSEAYDAGSATDTGWNSINDSIKNTNGRPRSVLINLMVQKNGTLNPEYNDSELWGLFDDISITKIELVREPGDGDGQVTCTDECPGGYETTPTPAPGGGVSLTPPAATPTVAGPTSTPPPATTPVPGATSTPAPGATSTPAPGNPAQPSTSNDGSNGNNSDSGNPTNGSNDNGGSNSNNGGAPGSNPNATQAPGGGAPTLEPQKPGLPNATTPTPGAPATGGDGDDNANELSSNEPGGDQSVARSTSDDGLPMPFIIAVLVLLIGGTAIGICLQRIYRR